MICLKKPICTTKTHAYDLKLVYLILIYLRILSAVINIPGGWISSKVDWTLAWMSGHRAIASTAKFKVLLVVCDPAINKSKQTAINCSSKKHS